VLANGLNAAGGASVVSVLTFGTGNSAPFWSVPAAAELFSMVLNVKMFVCPQAIKQQLQLHANAAGQWKWVLF
jgi:hypothetical protein